MKLDFQYLLCVAVCAVVNDFVSCAVLVVVKSVMVYRHSTRGRMLPGVLDMSVDIVFVIH